MTQTVNASKKSDIDPNFQQQVNKLKTDAEQEHQKRKQSDQAEVMMPEKKGWDGDLFTSKWESMSEPFKRDKANEDFIKAVENAQSPGVSGDLVATTAQIDLLSTMERAFRARHTMRFPRAVAQAVSRKKGHGHDQGVLKQLMLEYVRGVLKQASG